MSSPSFGHGAFPAVIGVVDENPLVILSTFGIWVPQENDRYNLFCEEIYQGTISPAVIKDKDGVFYVGMFKGIPSKPINVFKITLGKKELP